MELSNENMSIKKSEYERLKNIDNENEELKFADFALKIERGNVLSKESLNYNENRIKIEIVSKDFTNIVKYCIQIDGKEYNISNEKAFFDKIKNYISTNLDILINFSKNQTNYNLNDNVYDGGVSRKIQIKYGSLIININGQVRDIGPICDEFINEFKNLMIDYICIK